MMPLDVICFDCVGKFCYRCIYEKHKQHHSVPKEEFIDKVEEDKVKFEQILSQIEKKEAFLKSGLVEEIFKPQRTKKTMELKQNINDLYEKALFKLSKQREELIKKVDKGLYQKEEELKEKLKIDFKEHFQ